MKLQIFVSYCHEDIRPDDGRIKVFFEALRSVGRGTYQVLVDYFDQEAGIGANLPKYMNQIDKADAAIILLTPGYKDRVAKKGNSGVYYEFRRIYDRLLYSEEKNTYERSFIIFPIIFTGDFKDCRVPEIEHLISRDLTWLHVTPRGKTPQVRHALRARLNQFVDEIRTRIAAIAETKGQEYKESQEVLFRQFLFQDTKSRWNKPENYRYLDSAFVKTSTFLRARNREINFIVGRKGAGKSTITDVLPVLMVPAPTSVMQIDFDNIPFETCYNILRPRPAVASDLRHAFSPIYSYQLLWDVFLHLFFAWTCKEQLQQNSRLRSLLRRLLSKADSSVSDEPEKQAIAPKVLFVYAFEQLVTYTDLIMRKPREYKGISAAVGEFTITAFRHYVFGQKGWQQLQAVLSAYKEVGNSILITADGFDVMAGYFTKESEDSEDAAKFERELLLALFQIVLSKGPVKISGGKLYNISDFCIAIPHDKFIEVRKRDRDRYDYRNKFSRITWSGIELSVLVRKRLALLRGVIDLKGPSLEQRLTNVMSKGFPELPEELVFQFGSATYHIPLFIYVLRHTFWRPRDILYYYAALLAASDRFHKKKEKMPSAFARQVIAGCTRYILEDEFYEEFSASFRNLRQIMNLFRHSPQIMEWEELEQRLGSVRFETVLPKDETASIEWKLEVLFDLGAIGVMLDRKTSERLSSFRHAFSFNEDQLLTEKIGRDDYPQFQYALHPVFSESLHVDTTKNPELILAMDWKYLHDNEVLRGIVPV
jgi:energy-coupling factor transporter ATP-binding protein EcfA2